MEDKYFSLETSENTRLIKIIRIVFGIFCLVVAIYWLRFNISSIKSDATLWITILFLTGFGLYQILSGLGRTTRYIKIGDKKLIIKKNPVFSSLYITAENIDRIELFPLNIVFFLKSEKRVLLRFGTTYYENNEKIINEIISFAERNNIPMEVIDEKL